MMAIMDNTSERSGALNWPIYHGACWDDLALLIELVVVAFEQESSSVRA